MKAFIILLLVFSILSGLGFGALHETYAPDTVYDIAANSKPTKVTTEVTYNTMEGDRLTGFYVTKVNGNDTVFEYEYQKLATPADSLASGENKRIVDYKGVITYHDGVYTTGNQEDWKPGVGTAFDLTFNVKAKFLTDVEFNEDETILTAKVTPENSVNVFGMDLNAVDDIGLIVETNGVNLTMVTVTYMTQYGEIAIRTSYTYNVQNLFPEADAE